MRSTSWHETLGSVLGMEDNKTCKYSQNKFARNLNLVQIVVAEVSLVFERKNLP